MQLDDIRAFSADQERGAWLDLLDPVTGRSTGIRFKLAGPDSETQNRARLRLADDLSDVADADGRVSAEARERARLDSLARCILDWEISEGDEPLPLTHANAVRVLRASNWLQAEVDAFASSRVHFRKDAN